MQDRFAVGSAAKTNKEMVERTRNGGRTNVFAHRSRNANCYFIIPCKFNFVVGNFVVGKVSSPTWNLNGNLRHKQFHAVRDAICVPG